MPKHSWTSNVNSGLFQNTCGILFKEVRLKTPLQLLKMFRPPPKSPTHSLKTSKKEALNLSDQRWSMRICRLPVWSMTTQLIVFATTKYNFCNFTELDKPNLNKSNYEINEATMRCCSGWSIVFM